MVQNQFAAVDFNTIATQTLVPAVAGKRIIVFGYTLVNGVATGQGVQFKSGANNLSGVLQLLNAVGGITAVDSGSDTVALFFTDVGAALTMSMSAATQVGGHVAFKYS